MNKEELKQTMMNAEEQIHEEIKNLYPNSSVGLDGIVSINDYLDLEHSETKPLKILWILKERKFYNNTINYLSVFMKCLGEYKSWKKRRNSRVATNKR